MRFILGIFLLIALIANSNTAVFAQDDDLDKLSFEETPLSDEKSPYFAVGGGYIATMHFTNFDELQNNPRLANFAAADLKAPIFLSGGAGFVAIPFLTNFRVGVFAAAGGKQVSAVAGDTTRSLNYSIAYTGASIDYAIQPFKKFVILPGINIGGGALGIETGQSLGNRDYNTELGAPSNAANFYNKLSGSFAFVQPNLNLEYAVTAFSLLRVNAGYMFGFMGNWNADNSTSQVQNMSSKINSNGLTLQAGLFIGLFN